MTSLALLPFFALIIAMNWPKSPYRPCSKREFLRWKAFRDDHVAKLEAWEAKWPTDVTVDQVRYVFWRRDGFCADIDKHMRAIGHPRPTQDRYTGYEWFAMDQIKSRVEGCR